MARGNLFGIISAMKKFTTVEERLADWLGGAFAESFASDGKTLPQVRVLPATDLKFGDFQCNDAMGFAKLLHQSPRAIAQAALAKPLPDFVEKAEIAGPGFINITLKSGFIASALNELEKDASLGVPQSGEGKTVVIDYSSPNAAKQMHIGHIRSTVIGNAIDRLFREMGYRVIADNHLGDWGTQFGILIKGYRECLTDEERKNLTVANLEKCYVLSAAKAKEEDGVWKDACRRELVKLQQGDPENTALWKRFIDISIAEFERMYSLLGIKFDTYRGESYYNNMMPGVVERLVKVGIAAESEGALAVKFEDERLGVAIVRKSDGGFNYTTSDLACVESRVAEYAPERIIYVTDDRQQLHFKQFFAICAKLGIETKLVHVPFGLMSYQGKAISTREGNLIRLDDLLEEAKRRALAVIESGDRQIPGDKNKLAAQIGFGAIKYADLSHDPATAIDFNWDKALALEGNSGPYLQYAFARVSSLLDKAGEAPDGAIEITSPVEKKLALQILEYGNAVERAANAYKPSILADYLFALSQTYSNFYQTSPVLKAEASVRSSRLHLCALFGKVLGCGLRLLGIETPERI